MVSTNSIAPPEYPDPVRIVMPVRELITLSARGVIIRDLLLSGIDTERREHLTAVPGGPSIKGTLFPGGVPFPAERMVEPCVVFTIEALSPIDLVECDGPGLNN